LAPFLTLLLQQQARPRRATGWEEIGERFTC